MKSQVMAFVAALTLVVAGCAGGQYGRRTGTTTMGMVSADSGGSAYLYDSDGYKQHKLETKGDFQLPLEQCAEVRGRVDHSTNPSTLLVTGYDTVECR